MDKTQADTNQVRFSFIVPCYNVENYVDECISSLLSQTYRDFEIIIVDDGSTDNTYEKCNSWSKNDIRIKLFSKVNGGLSSARNIGMQNACGRFFVFVDSDDWIDPHSLFEFNKTIDDHTEILITRMNKVYPNERLPNDNDTNAKLSRYPSKAEAIKWIMKDTRESWPAPQYIVSSHFVSKKKICFKEGYLHEDIDWTTSLCCHAEVYNHCTYPWYFHRMQREGSITSVPGPKRVKDVIEIAHSFVEGDKRNDLLKLPDVERDMIIHRLMSSVYASLSLYKRLNHNDRTQIISVVDNYQSIFRYAPAIRHKLFNICMRSLGSTFALQLMSLLNPR